MPTIQLTARSFSRSSPKPSTNLSMYTRRNLDRLSLSFSSVVVCRKDGIVRGGGDGDSVGALTRGGLAPPLTSWDFDDRLTPVGVPLVEASESLSEFESSESLDEEADEDEDEDEEEEDEDEALEDPDDDEEDAVSLSKSIPVGLGASSSELESLSEEAPGEYEICLLLLFLAGLLAFAADAAAMVLMGLSTRMYRLRDDMDQKS